jgi:hypothetical protein
MRLREAQCEQRWRLGVEQGAIDEIKNPDVNAADDTHVLSADPLRHMPRGP